MLGRRKITYYRKALGKLDEKTGIWELGTEYSGTIIASCQPLNQDERSEYTSPGPEGEAKYSFVKLYSNEPLLTSKQSKANEADQIEVNGHRYKIIDVIPFQSGIISHYKMIAAEVADSEADKFAE